ncbi:hypothetical protein HO133_006582 [Letharia lupina]|uniref:NAD-dependent epimerase/dehydratase domain-containing protein n=1 Tax=Letharia lupina TaxID=560253 RepID=A0A8H6C5X9_9LECA|nr:uncharacterized protein HO133_006582 [Letharia lupina]KAF6217755.1 hypothetical protein HO133_006582 [Letharia lupina]
MAGDLILVTGATGHLGYRAVVLALEAGYQVRAAVRSQAKAGTILATQSIKALAPGSKLDFIIVPDIIADGAYDDAVKDVKAILHIASPLPGSTEDFERDIITPAIKGTTNILKAAAKEPSVRRIVITSSVVAVIPWAEVMNPKTNHVYTADKSVPDPSGPYEHSFEAYAAAKTKALNATKEFVKTEKPTFDVINVMPGFFVGKNELITNAKDVLSGTNAFAFGPVLGRVSAQPLWGSLQHVDDVAKVHVLSLSPKVEGNQDFGIQAGGTDGIVWDDSIEIVKRRFPEAVHDGRLPASGTQPTNKVVKYDTTRTEKVLGIKFQSYEDALVSVTEHYLELLEKESGKSEL